MSGLSLNRSNPQPRGAEAARARMTELPPSATAEAEAFTAANDLAGRTPAAGVSWKERALGTWRRQSLTQKLSQLLDIDVDQESIQLEEHSVSALLDGVRFRMKAGSEQLLLEANCRKCNQPRPPSEVQSLVDVGRAIEQLCPDCDFMARTGVDMKDSRRPWD